MNKKLILFVGLILSTLANAAFGAQSMKLYFKNEPILKMIEKYSNESNKKFVVDPKVRGRISIFNDGPVSMDEAYNQVSSALAINGFAILKIGETYQVRPARAAQRSLLEVSENLPSAVPERLFTWVYKVKHASSSEIMKNLRVLPSKDGEIAGVHGSNQIVITDWTSNLQRVSEILKKVDIKPTLAKRSNQQNKRKVKKKKN